MKHIDSFKIFEAKKNPNRFFDSYTDSDYTSVSGSNTAPGWKDWLYNMFKNLEDRFERFDTYYQQNIAVKDINGRPIDTGMGWLIGTAGSLAANVASKIFKPAGWGKVIKKDPATSGAGTSASDMTIKTEHQRLMNDSFMKNDLPKIKSDDDFKEYVWDYYKHAGVKPGINKEVDTGAATIANTYLNSKRGVLPAAPSITAETPVSTGINPANIPMGN